VWHAEDGRSALFLEEVAKIFVLYRFFRCDSLSWIVGQQLVKKVNELFRSIGKQLLEADALLLRKVKLILTHMRGPTFEQIYQGLFGSAQNLVDFVDLVELALAIEQRIFGDHLEQHTPVAPDVHFEIVVAIGHQALGCSVPSGGDVFRIGLFGEYA